MEQKFEVINENDLIEILTESQIKRREDKGEGFQIIKQLN